MLTTIARKVGNATAISIPKQLGVEVGETYLVYKGANGSITLIPKMNNPFLSDEPYVDAGECVLEDVAIGELENEV